MRILLSPPSIPMQYWFENFGKYEVRAHAGLGAAVVVAHLAALCFLLLDNRQKIEPQVPQAEVEVRLLIPPPRQSPATPVRTPARPQKATRPVAQVPALPATQSPTAIAEANIPAPTAVEDPRQELANTPNSDVPVVPQQVTETPPTISSGVEYVRAPQPIYPDVAKRRGDQGQVIFRVLIGTQGQVEKIEIQKHSGVMSLDEAGRQALLKAVFKPYLLQGKAVPVFVIVPISFKLDI